LKFVALRVPEIIGVLEKFGKSLDMSRPFSPKFLIGFCSHGPNLKFVALPVPEIIASTLKNLGRLCIRSRTLFSKIFRGLMFGWTLRIYLPNLKSLALAVPEIIAIAFLGWGCEPPI